MMEHATPLDSIEFPAGREGVTLSGSLFIPDQPVGLVIFAHGSGSSRFSPRNRAVADFLNRANLATLLFDLLTSEEHDVDQYTRQFLISGYRSTVGAIDWSPNTVDVRRIVRASTARRTWPRRTS